MSPAKPTRSKSLPRRRRSVIFPRPLEVVVKTEPVPKLKANQVLVRARRSLISTGTELTIFTADYPKGSVWDRYGKFPWSAGYSMAGDVVKAGRDVKDLDPGTRVMTSAHHTELFTLRPDACARIPRGVSHEEAAFQTLGVIVTGGVRRAKIQLGECVVVVGQGLLGQLACQLARINGARPVVAVDVAPGRLALARKLGAHVTINPKRKDLRQAIGDLTGGRMADVVFEVTGSPAIVPGLAKLLRREGRLMLLGSPRGVTSIDLHDEVHTLGLHIIGAHNSTHPGFDQPLTPWTLQRDGALFLELVRTGELNVRQLISHRFACDRAPQAYHMLHTDRSKAMGVILKWE